MIHNYVTCLRLWMSSLHKKNAIPIIRHINRLIYCASNSRISSSCDRQQYSNCVCMKELKNWRVKDAHCVDAVPLVNCIDKKNPHHFLCSFPTLACPHSIFCHLFLQRFIFNFLFAWWFCSSFFWCMLFVRRAFVYIDSI